MLTLDKNQPFLLVDDIDVHYGPVQALFGVSLQVQAGEVVSVLGGNASGKSTTLKSVLGLVHPSRGRILLEGEPIQGLSSPDVIERGVASVPEGRRVFPEMSVYENLLMGAYPRRAKKADIEKDLEEVYASFPRLAERRKQAAGTLSGGEQQMLALGRAWLRRGKLICIDEPSMGLSPKFVDMVYEVLFRCFAGKQRGRPFFWSSRTRALRWSWPIVLTCCSTGTSFCRAGQASWPPTQPFRKLIWGQHDC